MLPSKTLASESSITVIARKFFAPEQRKNTFCLLIFTLIASACARTSYDITNSTDRSAMIVQVQSDLTTNDCSDALTLSTQLYNSTYSNDQIRMLYASAQACNVGIQLYTLITNIGSSDFSSLDEVFMSLVKLFPSVTTDSRMQSSWYSQDALQSILNLGAVIAPANEINPTTNNPGSTVTTDRTPDANIYMAFIAMSVIGTTLNHYGYNAGDNPAALGYHPSVTLPWSTTAAVQNDTTGAACALSSGLLNMLDGIGSLTNAVTGTTSSALNNIVTTVTAQLSDTPISIACNLANPTISVAQCLAGVERLRYRGACAEQAPSSAAAAVIINAIIAGWR